MTIFMELIFSVEVCGFIRAYGLRVLRGVITIDVGFILSPVKVETNKIF